MKVQKHAVALAAVGFILLGSFAGCGGSSVPPFVGKLTPESVHAGSPAFTLTVTGDGFVSGSVVEMNSNSLE